MQKKFVLKKKTTVEDSKGKKYALIYRPDDFDEKEMSIVFKDDTIAEQMGLPTETIGDSVIVEFGAKEKQSKLIVNAEVKEKDEDKDKEKDAGEKDD